MEGGEERGEKWEGIMMYKLPVIESHREGIRNIKYSIRNMVTSTVITSYGVRWILVLSG